MKSITIALALVLLCPGMLHAELTPDQQQRARECIALFSVREFNVRQQAVEKLVRLGPDVLPLIRKTLAESDDNEVKLRCEMVIKGIRETYIVGPDDRPIALGASRHTLDFKDVPLEKVLEALARSSGNSSPEVRGGDPVLKKPVTLKVTDAPYWQVIDEVRKAAGLVWTYDYRTRGFLLQPGTLGDEVSVLAGPAVVKPWALSQSISLLNGTGTNSLSITWLCLWEDRLPVVYAQLVIGKMTAADGTVLPVPRVTARRSWWELCTGRFQTSITNPPRTRAATAHVEGFVRLEFAVGRREAVIPNVFVEGDKSITVEGLTLAVSDVRQWDRELRLTVKGTLKWPHPSLGTFSPDYGLFVRDASGKLHAPERVSSNYVSGGFDQTVSFPAPREAQAKSLVLVYPERTETRDYPFELKKVPLP